MNRLIKSDEMRALMKSVTKAALIEFIIESRGAWRPQEALTLRFAHYTTEHEKHWDKVHALLDQMDAAREAGKPLKERDLLQEKMDVLRVRGHRIERIYEKYKTAQDEQLSYLKVELP